MINFLLIVLHVLACLFLIVIVLLQAGKNADLSGAFGGSASQTAFGNRATGNFLTKMTTVMAVVFMLTCMILALRYNIGFTSTGGSIPLEDTKPATSAVPSSVPAPAKSDAVPAPTGTPVAPPPTSPAQKQ
jgi:preprotein translocase subunit SecG